MASLTREKIAQAKGLVGDVLWLTFVRETSEGGDPVLALLLDGSLTWQSALILTPSGRSIAIVGNYDADPLIHSGDWDVVVSYVQGIRDALLEVLEEHVPAGGKIAVNYSLDDVKADGLSHGMFLALQEMLKGTRFEGSLVSAEAIVSGLRALKTPGEIERIRAAIVEGDELFQMVGEFAQVGVSELAVYRLLQAEIDRRGLGYGWDRAGNPIVNSGPHSMIGHGKPNADIRLEPGHVFHIDLGVIKDGYSSDIQRCWFVGDSVPDDVARGFEAVRAALMAGAAALRVGVEGWVVDAAARASLVASGYEEYLHAFGHQVGRVAHDGGAILGPRWERYGRIPFMPVRAGEVYTLELGVILPGRGYLGLEEIVAVRDGGLDWLSAPQTRLPVLGVDSVFS